MTEQGQDSELSREEEELLARGGSGRGYTPKGDVAEPDDAPSGAAGTSHAEPGER